MNIRQLWNAQDFERGMYWASLVAIAFYTLFPSPDYDLQVEHTLNVAVPYGFLWTLLNPAFWTTTLYAGVLFFEWSIVTFVQFVLVKYGYLDRKIVRLQVFSVAVMLALHAQQNVTVIMFAPFATINPLFTLLLLFQKLPLGWSLIPWNNAHWDCAFNGGATIQNLATNPCLSNSLKLAFWTHVYFVTYIFIAFWLIVPIIMWYHGTWRHSKNCRTHFKPIPQWKKELVAQLLSEMLREGMEEEIAEEFGSFWNSVEGTSVLISTEEKVDENNN